MRENRKLVKQLSGTKTNETRRSVHPLRRAEFFSESLILAQNERWQRGLGMQVERDPGGSNTLR